MIHIFVNYICWTNEINWTSNDHTICLVHIESSGFASKKKSFVSKEQTIKININKNPLSKERNSNCKDLSLTMVANKNLLSKEKNSKCKDLSLAYYKLFIAKKCNSIFSTSVIKVGVPLKNLKAFFGFMCRYLKIYWKEQLLLPKTICGHVILKRYWKYGRFFPDKGTFVLLPGIYCIF